MSASPLGNNTANDYTSPQGYTATQSGYGIASPISAPQQAGAPFYGGQSTQRSMSQDDNTTSDAYSARSAMTASNAAPTVKHPDMHQSGLNSSIVETVSAWFDNGMITRAVVIGELALAHNSTSNFPGAAAAESIRLENFHSLEKVAPNPAFVKQLQDRAGEYTIDTSSIARTAVAFKYQVHLDTTSMARQAPLLLVPSWKVEATQTSVILNYSLNPAFLASTPQQQVVTISNVVITLHLDGATATSCLSKPTGTFSRERSAIYWSLDDLVLRADQGPQRLLARFVTESEARPGRAEARWEIGGGQAERLGSGLHVSQLDSAGAAGDTDPFADEENATAGAGGPWKRVGLVRKLVSGTYIAN